jgi:CheY-like chemotaxis protein
LSLLILVVDDESDVEVLFRQQFRRDLRAGRFSMEFAQSAPVALQRIIDAGDRSRPSVGEPRGSRVLRSRRRRHLPSATAKAVEGFGEPRVAPDGLPAPASQK